MRHRQLAFDFLDAAFDETLAVLGSVVICVFAQVALCARFGNCGDHSGTLDRFETVEFFLELLSAALRDWDGGHSVKSP